MKSLLLFLVAAAVAAPALAGEYDARAPARARTDYLLHCSGCHGQDGEGKPWKGIPKFAGQVGHFQRTPESRAFLMQVPGLLGAGLGDERAAAVTTWLVREFAGASLPAGFTPYTTEEARRYREARPVDVIGRRNELYDKLNAAGYPVE